MSESIDLLRCRFGLTPAEAKLALQLVAGETLRAAAVKLNITYETARTELKNIFNKTETCRQAELVIVIVTALPHLRLSNPLIEPREGLAQTNKFLTSSNKSPEGSHSD
jgi:DNA-binding CsgD family transcriptional regulator